MAHETDGIVNPEIGPVPFKHGPGRFPEQSQSTTLLRPRRSILMPYHFYQVVVPLFIRMERIGLRGVASIYRFLRMFKTGYLELIGPFVLPLQAMETEP